MNITQDVVRERLCYEPETGRFVWITKRGRAVLGDDAGHAMKNGYIQIGLCGRLYYAHRLAWLYMTGGWPDLEVDHINGNPSDNRWSNLRGATSRLNKENRHAARSGTGLLGAYPSPGGRFRASITVAGVEQHLGTFATAADAHSAYLAAKRTLHQGCTI